MGGGCLPIGSHLGMSDLMKPLDPSKAFSGGFSASMGKFHVIFNQNNGKNIDEVKKQQKRMLRNTILIIKSFVPFFQSGQHSHLSSSLHPAHAHMHSGWYASGMGALGASGSLQSGFSSGGLGGGMPHSQSYHLMVSNLRSKIRKTEKKIFIGM